MSENVGVVGLGLLGQLAVPYLVLLGARKIIAIDPVPSRLDMAQAHGATHTVASDVRQAREPIEEITGGKMLDVVYDITGNPAVLPCSGDWGESSFWETRPPPPSSAWGPAW